MSHETPLAAQLMDWFKKLSDLYGGLGQDPLDDVGSLMDITGTDAERNEWLAALDAGLDAARAGDRRLLDAINAGTGFAIAELSSAVDILRETRAIYLREIAQ